MATTHSNHYGAAAYWAMMALDHGMIGLSSTNAPAVVAPTGGRTPMLGTNPFAVAIPAGQEQPMVLDLATTVVARGRILLYAKQNKPLEPGWAFDELGRPTVDPHEAVKGLLAPIGGYKGYGNWDTIEADFHWYIELMPRLTGIAGFEWGSGFYINPTAPEEAAKYLREAEI